MSGSSDELLVGALCLLVVAPWIGWTIRRGLAQGRLPVGRGHVVQEERPGPFRVLLGFYVLAAAAMGFIRHRPDLRRHSLTLSCRT